MREILFRGKSILDNKWIYGTVEFHLVDGDLTQTKQDAFITYDSMDKTGEVYRDRHEVDLATVGQFTGLTDKNGEKIFEGDIVWNGVFKAKVEFSKGYFYPFTQSDICTFYQGECEVIGTIYDFE